jgi:hypothetical protein
MVKDYPDYTDIMQIIGSDIMIPIDLQAAYIMMPVDIQAQYLTLDIDIIAQSVGNLDVNIAAADIGTISIDISAQTIGDITVSIDAQSLGIYLQPEWQSKAGKTWKFRGQQAVGANTFATVTCGTAPPDVAYFVTDVSIMTITNPARLAAHFFKSVDATTTSLCQIGGNCGASHPFRTPPKLVEGEYLKIELWNLEDASRDFQWAAFGYYEDV